MVRGGKDAYVGAHRRRGSAPRVGGAGRTFKSSERRRSRRLDPLPCQLELLAPWTQPARCGTLDVCTHCVGTKVFLHFLCQVGSDGWVLIADGIAQLKRGCYPLHSSEVF